MDSDQESSECPLCLEVLEADDLNFYPCTCCYQICRFCWHRIRTDENGLCPACRKPYSEDPAQFKPLTDEEIQQVKRERKLKESNKKPKITESRKHLANLRVVQRNLVFVNGLPSRLADTELLRRNDYFGKYGKIVKLVTSPAHNGQLNSICVYITYSRSEEALKAIQALCNYYVDGRTLKATLGTTKYCSRYLKGATCQKTDCLYLHEPGDPLASFTKEQMQQGLHLEYERKLMEQYTNKNASAHSTNTPKASRNSANGHKNESPQRRKHHNQPTPLLPPSNTTLPTNGHSDFESGDETHQHTSDGYNIETFTSTTTNNVDSDCTSTSSQTSSEQDPQVASSTNPTQAYYISPNNNWQEERTSFSTTNNLAPSQSQTTKSVSPTVRTSYTANQSPPTTTPNNHLLIESTSYPIATTSTNSINPSTTTIINNTNHNNTVRTFDQLPEYKLFGSSTPSIHTIVFGNQENNQSSQPSCRSLLNGSDHDVRVIEKKLMESSLTNGDTSSLFPMAENDDLGFDPCSVFMSALAPDIENERQPSSTMMQSRFMNSSYQNHPSQYPPGTNHLPQSQSNPSWLAQTQHSPFHDLQSRLLVNGTSALRPKQPEQQLQFPLTFNGASPRQMWNGNQQQQQQQQQQQYMPPISSRLEFASQLQSQQLSTRQVSPSSQYSQSVSNPLHLNKSAYSSNSTMPINNLPTDLSANLRFMDPAIISFGGRVEPSSVSSTSTTASSQWPTTTQSQGSSTMSSGNNLISTSRWSQPQNQQIQFPPHMMTNGIYGPYSTTSISDDTNRS